MERGIRLFKQSFTSYRFAVNCDHVILFEQQNINRNDTPLPEELYEPGYVLLYFFALT
jgi:hypothetical protein